MDASDARLQWLEERVTETLTITSAQFRAMLDIRAADGMNRFVSDRKRESLICGTELQ